MNIWIRSDVLFFTNLKKLWAGDSDVNRKCNCKWENIQALYRKYWNISSCFHEHFIWIFFSRRKRGIQTTLVRNKWKVWKKKCIFYLSIFLSKKNKTNTNFTKRVNIPHLLFCFICQKTNFYNSTLVLRNKDTIPKEKIAF